VEEYKTRRGTPGYSSWNSMKQRCYNRKHEALVLHLGLGTVQNRVKALDTKPHRGYILLPYNDVGRELLNGL